MAHKTDYMPQKRAELLYDVSGPILSVRVRGEIDHHTAADIRQGIDGMLFERRPQRLILDLSAISFMDSSGLGLIMGRFSVMRELGGEMTVWNPSRETRSILALAGMERLVRIEYPAGEEVAEGGEPRGVRPPERAGGGMGTPTRPRRRKNPTAAPAAHRKEKDA